MKKLLVLALALVLCLSCVSALAEGDKVGLYCLTEVGTATDAKTVDGDKYDGKYQINTTVCTVTLGDDGIIKYVKFDVAQTNVGFTTEGACTTAVGTIVKSKEEKKYDYGMTKASAIGKDWFEQIAAFEAYCIGKTVEEVAATPFYALNESHTTCADVPELKTTCTMTVGEYIEALKLAAAVAK